MRPFLLWARDKGCPVQRTVTASIDRTQPNSSRKELEVFQDRMFGLSALAFTGTMIAIAAALMAAVPIAVRMPFLITLKFGSVPNPNLIPIVPNPIRIIRRRTYAHLLLKALSVMPITFAERHHVVLRLFMRFTRPEGRRGWRTQPRFQPWDRPPGATLPEKAPVLRPSLCGARVVEDALRTSAEIWRSQAKN
jgi:hypothetical protein